MVINGPQRQQNLISTAFLSEMAIMIIYQWQTGLAIFLAIAIINCMVVKNANIASALSVPRNYIAISHVWPDGTGVELKTPGYVNSCLFAYSANIATQLGCEGIWWDTVCIPGQRETRRIAMNNMHKNYEEAEFTVIYDSYLLEVDWADDGSPALALVLSPGFSRSRYPNA
jgi:hypothetical protein